MSDSTPLLPVPPVPDEAADFAAEARGHTEWYRSAVFYEALLGSYADGNRDGIGDFVGLASKLDYLCWLGIDAVWVPPFYRSPHGDGGYDVADYLDVDPRYGTLGDFDRFIEEAHRNDVKVVIDLVLNHTSSAHPWFEASRTDPEGPFGDYYVWRDDDTGYADSRIIFIDTEDSNWAFDDVRGQYYWHRFFSHQPDLNFENETVHAELLDVIRFWCDRGVDGLRLDAVPYLYEAEGTNCENLPRTHEFIAKVRRMLDREYPGVMLIAEANQPPEEVVQYYGTDQDPECHLCFHFPLMPQIFRSLHTGEVSGILRTWRETPVPPAEGIWGLFLRNHDELTLEMVTDEEREQMYRWYATEPRMRANVGIRRRLAPLLDGDRRKLELAHALLLSLPGAPFLYYGDEIGMGDAIELADRYGVRTPMQWNDSEGAGFSEVPIERFTLPLVTRPGYSPQEVSVAAQEGDPGSLLNWLRGLLAARLGARSLQDGQFELIGHDNPAVLAYWRRGLWRSLGDNAPVVCLFNFSESDQEIGLDLADVPEGASARWIAGEATLTYQDGDDSEGEPGNGGWMATIPARGFGWIELG